MAATQAEVAATVQRFLERTGRDVELRADTLLYADGIGLDSMETAELSALLEDDFGTDPYSDGDMPQTFGDILAFYAAAGTA